MKIEVVISDEEFEILEERASKNNVSISEYVRGATLEKLENDDDIEAADKAYSEYLKNPVTYSAEEVFARAGL